jgi:hypothetical protein
MCICELPISDRHNELLGGKGGRVLGWREGTTGTKNANTGTAAIKETMITGRPVSHLVPMVPGISLKQSYTADHFRHLITNWNRSRVKARLMFM